MADRGEELQGSISGRRFRSFQAPVLPPAVPEEVVELFQQSQNPSADISRTTSAIQNVAPEPEIEPGSITLENEVWKVRSYVDCKEVVVHVEHEEQSVSVRDCAGYKAPTVITIRGVCRNLSVTNCINVVLLTDGVRGSAILTQILEMSVYICSFCPSPLSLREIDGLQISGLEANLHSSISVTKGDDVCFKVLNDDFKPVPTKKSGWNHDSDSEDGPKKDLRKEEGGGFVQIGHMTVPRRRHIWLPAKELITLAPVFTTKIPREGVFVLQEGRLTKSADPKAPDVPARRRPTLHYNGAGHPPGSHGLGHHPLAHTGNGYGVYSEH